MESKVMKKRVLQLGNPRRSLRARLSISAGIVTFIFWTILVVVIVFISTSQLTKYRGSALADYAQALSEAIDKELFERLREIENLARFPIYSSPISQDLAAVRFSLEQVRETYDYYAWIGVAALNGTVLASSPPGVWEGVDISNRSVFTNALSGKPYAGNLHTGRMLQSLLPNSKNQTLRFLDFSALIYDYPSNQTIGVLCAYVNWDWVHQFELSLYSSSFRVEAELFIFNESSSIALAPQHYAYVPRVVVPVPWLQQFVSSNSLASHFSVNEWNSPINASILENSKRLVGAAKCQGYRDFVGMPWVVVVTLPENAVLSPITSLRNKAIICGVCFWFALTLMLLGISTQIVSPLTRMAVVATEMLDGEFRSRSRDRDVGGGALGSGSRTSSSESSGSGGSGHELDAMYAVKNGMDTARTMEECAREQDELLEGLWLRDEVYVLCKMVRALARTFTQQRILAQTMEQRVQERTNHLQREIKFREKVQATAEEAQKSAEIAEAAKTRFLANMSHEIRTPMNGILGTIQLLLETPLMEDQHDYVRTMKYSADSLLSIINDVLMFSKLESNHFQLRASVFQMEHVFEGVGELLGPLCAEKGLGAYFMVDPAVPESLVGDYGRLQQVLINLAGNSLKFTNYPGEILVICSVGCSTCYLRSVFNGTEASPFQHGGGPHNCSNLLVNVATEPRRMGEEMEKEREIDKDGVFLEFEVRDTGCGISQEQIGRLFTPFFQADSSTTRSAGGTGLGLSICKQLVELFGGQVNVHSILGTGSSFHFTSRFQLPSLSMLRTASLLSRRALEKSKLTNSGGKGNTQISTTKSNKGLNLSIPLHKLAKSNSPELHLSATGNNNNNSITNTTSTSAEELRKESSKVFNLMVTSSSNRQMMALLSPPAETVSPEHKYSALGQHDTSTSLSRSDDDQRVGESTKREEPIMAKRNSGDMGARRSSADGARRALVESDDKAKPIEEERCVLISADRVTFQRAVSYRLNCALPYVRCEVTFATGRELSEQILAGVDGKSYGVAILYHSNYDNLLSSVEAMGIAKIRSCSFIAICPMAASFVRKRLTFLGVRHLPTPLCFPKLIRIVEILLRDGHKNDSPNNSPFLVGDTLKPSYSTSANFLRAYEDDAAQALARSIINSASPSRLLPPLSPGSPRSPPAFSNTATIPSPRSPHNAQRTSPTSPTSPLRVSGEFAPPSSTPTHGNNPTPNININTTTPTNLHPLQIPLGIIPPSTPLASSTSNSMSSATSTASFPFNTPMTAPATPQYRVPVRVLIAEDNKTNMMILTKYLQKTGTGVKIVAASDGAEAVAEVKSHPLGYYSLILMDLHMPNVDGLQATRQIRNWEKEQLQHLRPRALSVGNSSPSNDSLPLLDSAGSHASARTYAQTYAQGRGRAYSHALAQQPHRIIALTADVMPGVSEECEEAGMDGFLTKPLDYRNLLRIVQEVCESVNMVEPSHSHEPLSHHTREQSFS